MRHDATYSVHCPQIHTILFDFKAIGIQLSTCFKNLQITISLDVQIMEDEETNLFLVHFVVNGGLYSFLKVGVKLCVLFPNLLWTVHKCQGSENSDAGIHHVDLVKMFYFDPASSCSCCSTFCIMHWTVLKQGFILRTGTNKIL